MVTTNRIRLTGLLRKPLQRQGFLFGRAPPVHREGGTAASAYGAASSLITLLLWIYYSSQILLFGAEFTQVYAARAGRAFVPDEYAVRV